MIQQIHFWQKESGVLKRSCTLMFIAALPPANKICMDPLEQHYTETDSYRRTTTTYYHLYGDLRVKFIDAKSRMLVAMD